jgi:hypothetical protein
MWPSTFPVVRFALDSIHKLRNSDHVPSGTLRNRAMEGNCLTLFVPLKIMTQKPHYEKTSNPRSGGGCVVLFAGMAAPSFAWKFPLPCVGVLSRAALVHSYDRRKGSFYSRSERSSLWVLRHRYIYEWITLALSIIAHRAPREAAVQPPCRQTHRLCETQEDDTADRSDQFVTKNSSLNLF